MPEEIIRDLIKEFEKYIIGKITGKLTIDINIFEGGVANYNIVILQSKKIKTK